MTEVGTVYLTVAKHQVYHTSCNSHLNLFPTEFPTFPSVGLQMRQLAFPFLHFALINIPFTQEY